MSGRAQRWGNLGLTAGAMTWGQSMSIGIVAAHAGLVPGVSLLTVAAGRVFGNCQLAGCDAADPEGPAACSR
jgi:hypothetical protein